MATTFVTSPDYYLIGLTNYGDDGYAKNSVQQLGGYVSRSAYCWEAVHKIDYSNIPSGSTITSVIVDVNIVDNNCATDNIGLDIREQDKGTWVEVDGSQPTRLNPAFFDENGSGNEYANVLSSVPIPATATGIFTIPSSQNLVDMVQNQLDGVKDPDNGLIITYYTGYYGYYCTVDTIQITVEYEGGSSTRRRVMIIS